MIIPINNGGTITPIYIPDPVVTTNYSMLEQSNTNSSMLEQSNTNVQNNEPTLASWIMIGVILILLIACVVCFIKMLEYFFGGEE